MSFFFNATSIKRVILFVLFLVAFTGTFSPLPILALPQDAIVKAGSVQFEQPFASRLNVIQNTEKAIIDWRSFNIAGDEHTDFQMPSSTSINLSRVIGNDPSNIFGKLSSNGRLMLINPNGILFGRDSRVDVNGLVASTIDIRNENFLSGNYSFNISPEFNRSIVNRGEINVIEGGMLAFVAPGIESSGIVNARLGQVDFASGKVFTLDFYGDKLITLEVDSKIVNEVLDPDGNKLSRLINNSGEINADGGVVTMQVNMAKNLVDKAINFGGVVKANTVMQKDGKIILSGGDNVVNITGKLSASGEDAGEQGGSIDLSGSEVLINLGEVLTTSASDQGGRINLFGADWVSLGGKVYASGISGGNIDVDTGRLSLAAPVFARGTTGTGGKINFRTRFKSWGNTDGI